MVATVGDGWANTELGGDASFGANHICKLQWARLALGWSEYDYIHSRRRNRLGVQLASDLSYDLTKGHNMARLSRRFKKSRYEQKLHAHTDSDDPYDDPSDYGSDNLW